METKTETVKYPENFGLNCGYGCGYVLIPKGHPILVKLLMSEDSYFYLQPDGFMDEITLSEWDSKETDFYRIGFDTSHSWNTSQNSGKEMVETRTQELKDLVDSYTELDAKKEVEIYFNNLKERFNKYL